MKNLKKVLALLVAALILTASVGALAEYTVTINQNTADQGTHTYGAYQIFTGSLATDGTLSNIQWGSGISDAGKTALGDASTYAAGITESNAAAKAAELSGYLTTAEHTSTTTEGVTAIAGLAGGYYLIKDEDSSPSGSDPKAQTKFILKVLKDETVTVKSSVPSVEKKVKDKVDTTDSSAYETFTIGTGSDATTTQLVDSADYDIGDVIPYTVTATIGSGISNYDSYSLQFVDTMSKGLTLDQTNWDITVGQESIKSLFTGPTSTAGDNDATIWTWAARDIKSKITDGSQVVLTYQATLNKDAVVGSAGNPNTVKLKFDNNPNDSGKGTPGGETPPDTNIVFTYKTVFNKVKNQAAKATATVEEYNAMEDADKAKYDAVYSTEEGKENEVVSYKSKTQPLTGADFKLEKKVDNEWKDVTTMGSGDNKPTKTGGTTGSTFTFSGLDAGVYKLTETVTPEGYNSIAAIEFTITAEHDIVSDTPGLTSLTGTDGASFTMTPNVEEGSLTSDILNEKGNTLPSTGGIGTTIFYVAGSILVLAAVILLITKRRMGNED